MQGLVLMPKLIMKELAIEEYLERFERSRVEQKEFVNFYKRVINFASTC